MRGILLISHGHFAKGLKESAEMLCGACPQVFAVCLDSSDSPEVFVDKLSRAYESASVYGKVLVLCDLLGGTPCNLALQLLADRDGAVLLAGMNLPMLMTAVLQEAELELLIKESREAIVEVLGRINLQYVECEEE